MSLEIRKTARAITTEPDRKIEYIDGGVANIFVAGEGEEWTPLFNPTYVAAMKAKGYGYMGVGGSTNLSEITTGCLEAYEIPGGSYPVHLVSFAGYEGEWRSHQIQLFNYQLVKNGELSIPEVNAVAVATHRLLDQFGSLLIADTVRSLYGHESHLMSELTACGLYPKQVPVHKGSEDPFFHAVSSIGLEAYNRKPITGFVVRRVPENVIRVDFKNTRSQVTHTRT